MEGRPVWGNGAMLETKPPLEMPSNAERAKGRDTLASFSLLFFSLPPKPSWSQLARESAKVVCRRRVGPGNGSNYKQANHPHTQAGVWGRGWRETKGQAF